MAALPGGATGSIVRTRSLISTRRYTTYDRIGDASAWQFVPGYTVTDDVGLPTVGPRSSATDIVRCRRARRACIPSPTPHLRHLGSRKRKRRCTPIRRDARGWHARTAIRSVIDRWGPPHCLGNYALRKYSEWIGKPPYRATRPHPSFYEPTGTYHASQNLDRSQTTRYDLPL
jgi:hypothetical protein